jgi:antitoxin YefM
MGTVSYSELRQQLKAQMDRVCANRAPLLVTRQGGESVVMLSLAEYESLEEYCEGSFSGGSANPSRCSVS